MQDFKRLAVWHKAHACFLAFYRAFGTGATATSFGLRAQVLRAAASIPANIAEGCGKTSTKEFLRFLDIAIGSARELENHLIVARDISLISRDVFFRLNDQVTEVQRMLVGLINALKAQPPRP
jgi:four helix bundle protein